MPLPTERYIVNPPGVPFPSHIVERMKRFHPHTQLVWNWHYKCYQIIQMGDDLKWSNLRLLRTRMKAPLPPTLENTVGYLDAHDIRQYQTRYELEQWLNKIDEHSDGAEKDSEDRARGMIEEGADRQWRAEGKRIPFVLNPSHGEPTYSGEAGRPSSPAGE